MHILASNLIPSKMGTIWDATSEVGSEALKSVVQKPEDNNPNVWNNFSVTLVVWTFNPSNKVLVMNLVRNFLYLRILKYNPNNYFPSQTYL